MPTYIALLRGINVSGKRLVKMADLRARLAILGFQNVRTYIQSGNIVFEAHAAKTRILEEKIASLISDVYGFDIPVIVFNASVWRSAWEYNPWKNDSSKDIKYMHLTFLSENPNEAQLQLLHNTEVGEELAVFYEKWLYLYMPNGYGRGKLTNNFIEKTLQVNATTRNWKTVGKLLEML